MFHLCNVVICFAFDKSWLHVANSYNVGQSADAKPKEITQERLLQEQSAPVSKLESLWNRTTSQQNKTTNAKRENTYLCHGTQLTCQLFSSV